MKRFLLVATLLYVVSGYGNNMFVSDVRQIERDLSAGTTTFSFDITWDNSWRIEGGANNWDAAWIFVKYRTDGGNWQHLTLKGVERAPSGCRIDLTSDTRGAFVYRDAPGFGTTTFHDIVLIWDDAADNVAKGAVVTLRVLAVEMVYVPEGPFSLGSGGGLTSEFHLLAADPATRTPYRVTSQASIPVGTAVGSLNYETSNNGGDGLGPIPASFPKGYRAFYCMKYEVSQEQYAGFFNTLTQTQKQTLYALIGPAKSSAASVARNTLDWSGGGDAEVSLPAVPMNFVRDRTINAYLDWSGLRPMTELEFEKAGRGPLDPVAGEYAWGTTAAYATTFALSNAGSLNERITNTGRSEAGLGSASYTTTSPLTGPLRVGIYSTNSQSLSREEAGSSFYGVMELSGNLYESVITTGTPAGRAFEARHGDGILATDGNANVPTWNNAGAAQGARGGSYGTGAADMAISLRLYAVIPHAAQGLVGFRGVRSAPAN